MTRDETLALYAKGGQAWNAWAKEMRDARQHLIGDGQWIDDVDPAQWNAATRGWYESARADFNGHTFATDADFSRFEFPAWSRFDNVTFERGVLFCKVSFEGETHFHRTTFAKGAQFDNAVFKGAVWAYHLTIEGDSSFYQTTFDDMAFFDNATFQRSTIFDEAVFKKSASFDKTSFVGGAAFANATFEGGASFIEATFEHWAVLPKMNVKGFASFANTTFTFWVTFDNAFFEGPTQFYNKQFKERAFFKGSTLIEKAWFEEATFKGQATFENATFGHETFFNNVTFEEQVLFDHSTFQGEAHFKKALFEENAFFNNVTFEGHASFDSVSFKNLTNFTKSAFERDVLFNSATFGDRTLFNESTFEANTKFDNATFYKYGSFEDARFRNSASFVAIRGHREFSLARATFRTVPDFEQAHFNAAPRLDNLSIEPWQFSTAIVACVKGLTRLFERGRQPALAVAMHKAWFGVVHVFNLFMGIFGAANGRDQIRDRSAQWRSLKRLAQQSHDHIQEQEFFRGEMKSRRFVKDMPWHPVFWIGLFYEILSNFGKSIIRPVLWFVVATSVFASLYLDEHMKIADRNASGAEWYVERLGEVFGIGLTPPVWCLNGSGSPAEAALELSLHRALPVLGFASGETLNPIYACLYGVESRKPQPAGKLVPPYLPNVSAKVRYLGILQGLVSAVLLFLLLLSIRNNFRIQ